MLVKKIKTCQILNFLKISWETPRISGETEHLKVFNESGPSRAICSFLKL